VSAVVEATTLIDALLVAVDRLEELVERLTAIAVAALDAPHTGKDTP
jgi:hypothetical protein